MRLVPFCAVLAAAFTNSACDLPVPVDVPDSPRMAVIDKDTRVPFAWYVSRCTGGEFLVLEGFYSYTVTSDSLRVGIHRTYGYHFAAQGVATDGTTGTKYNYSETQSLHVKLWPDTTEHTVTSLVNSHLVARGNEADSHMSYLFHVAIDRDGQARAYVENAREVCTDT